MAESVLALRPEDCTGWLQYADFLMGEGEMKGAYGAIWCLRPPSCESVLRITFYIHICPASDIRRSS
jgi:uncharacterized protein (TIGR02996 family)